MELSNATVLVTGANRGIGLALVRAFLDAGAARVYATSRSGEVPVDDERVVPLRLDVTDPASIAEAARRADDVDIVVNNAGVSSREPLVTGDVDVMRAEMDANFWGPVLVARAFAPHIAGRGGGTIVNVASALAMVSIAGAATYAASKAALWSVSDGLRLELADQHVHVVTAFLAATETDMMAGWDGAMNTPAHVAGAILDGIRDGADEVFVDDDSRAVKASLSASVGERYPDLARSRGRSDLRREDVGVA